MISENEFFKLFKNKRKQNIEQFIKTYKVKTSNDTYNLENYIQIKNIDIEDIKHIKDFIENKEVYLKGFYNTSLKIPDNLSITESPMKNKEYNNNININYKNVIRNLHFNEILKNTKSGFTSMRSYLVALLDLFNNKIIDYKLLTPSALFYIRKKRFGGVLSSYYFRASILSPYLIYSLNKTLLKGTVVFTPTLGWTSYLYGLLESRMVTEYVGTDVIKSVCEKTKEFAKNYPYIKTKIYNKPSESLIKNKSFISSYREHFDLVFFSPPYYKLELYEGENQSTEQYKSYDEWLSKYWEETIKLCEIVLKKGGKLCYIISGYGKEEKSEFDLIKDMNKITRKYFKFKSMQNMDNKNVNVLRQNQTNEQIVLYYKNT